ALGELGIWVRLHYVYPYPHVDDLMPLMADGKILPCIDIPVQHASPRVLKAMRRLANQEQVLDRIRRWRDQVPGLTIRSTFIVGFPGETDEDFEFLLDWLKEAQLDRVGVFRYEAVEGAAANDLAALVPDDVREERWHRFMDLQQEISAERMAAKVGQVMDVIVDDMGDTDDGETQAIARSQGDAPEIDGNVFVNLGGRPDPAPGTLLKVRITDADEYDLWAEIAD